MEMSPVKTVFIIGIIATFIGGSVSQRSAKITWNTAVSPTVTVQEYGRNYSSHERVKVYSRQEATSGFHDAISAYDLTNNVLAIRVSGVPGQTSRRSRQVCFITNMPAILTETKIVNEFYARNASATPIPVGDKKVYFAHIADKMTLATLGTTYGDASPTYKHCDRPAEEGGVYTLKSGVMGLKPINVIGLVSPMVPLTSQHVQIFLEQGLDVTGGAGTFP